MPMDMRLSAAVQKLGLEFDRTEYAQLPNGKKIGYPVSGTDYSLLYGLALDSLLTVGPVDIDLGMAWLTRGSEVFGQARLFVGSSAWVNDIFEVRALGGGILQSGDSGPPIVTLGASFEVSCPMSDWFSLSLAYSPSISGGQTLSLGVGWMLSHPVKNKIRRESIATALAQATQTLNEIRTSLSADTILAVAWQHREPAQVTLRCIAALGNVVNFMVYPKYPWVNPNGLGFSEWVAKARGEVAFAKSLGIHPWDQGGVAGLEQEVNNLPSQLALTLATDIAADTYDILKTLQKMKGQNQQSLVAGYVGDYRLTVKNIENITTDTQVKRKIRAIVLPVLNKLDALDAGRAKPL